MENKKSKRIFKVVMAAMSLALVAAISYGATMALMSNTTNNKQNTFTSSESVNIALDEPSWTYGTTGTSYSPGQEYAKDPQITNNADSANSYVALKIEFFVAGSAVTYNYFTTNIADLQVGSGTGYNTTNWKALESSKTDVNGLILYYGTDSGLTLLSTGDTTPTAFDSVKFKSESTLKTTSAYNNVTNSYNNVEIKVTAYAVDAQGLTDKTISATPTDGSAQKILDDLITP